MAQANRTLDPQTLAVRAAMTQHVPHPLEAGVVHVLLRIQLDDAGYAAHDRFRRVRHATFLRDGSSAESSLRNRRLSGKWAG